jgi:hypothetical protein
MGRRQAASRQRFTFQLADTVIQKGRTAKGDKQVERVGNMACILALLCTDMPEAQVFLWGPKFCLAVKDAVEQ